MFHNLRMLWIVQHVFPSRSISENVPLQVANTIQVTVSPKVDLQPMLLHQNRLR